MKVRSIVLGLGTVVKDTHVVITHHKILDNNDFINEVQELVEKYDLGEDFKLTKFCKKCHNGVYEN